MNSKINVGDRVLITKEGLASHRQHHRNNSKLIAIAAEAIPFGDYAKEAANIAWTESTHEALKASVGIVKEIRERWFWQSGNDYLVVWAENEESWHLSKHLVKAEKKWMQRP